MTTAELIAAHCPEEFPFRLPRQPFPCCYFLCSEAEVKYVGQTVRLPTRIAEHVGSKPPFDQVFFVPTTVRKLTSTESLLITSIKPPWNCGRGGCDLDFNKIRKRFGLRAEAMIEAWAPKRPRDEQAARIFKLESGLSKAQALLKHAIKTDNLEIVALVYELLGEILSGRVYESR